MPIHSLANGATSGKNSMTLHQLKNLIEWTNGAIVNKFPLVQSLIFQKSCRRRPRAVIVINGVIKAPMSEFGLVALAHSSLKLREDFKGL